MMPEHISLAAFMYVLQLKRFTLMKMPCRLHIALTNKFPAAHFNPTPT